MEGYLISYLDPTECLVPAYTSIYTVYYTMCFQQQTQASHLLQAAFANLLLVVAASLASASGACCTSINSYKTAVTIIFTLKIQQKVIIIVHHTKIQHYS